MAWREATDLVPARRETREPPRCPRGFFGGIMLSLLDDDTWAGARLGDVVASVEEPTDGLDRAP